MTLFSPMGPRDCEFESYKNTMLSWKLSLLKIPLDKELTANYLTETCTNLEELILATMVLMWAD